MNPRRRGCTDWHRTQSSLPRPGSTGIVPVPAEALELGLAEFARSGGLTRRDALAGGVGLLVGAMGLPGLSTRRMLEAASAAAAGAPNAKTLVLIYQDGGNDGLNTLVPLADPRYLRLRKRIGIPAEKTLALNGVSDFGWHPALGGLKRLFDAGKVAVLPSVDFANPDQSHFNSQAYWRSGIVGPAPDRTGWLGRALDVIGTPDNPLQGISVTYGFDPVLRSKRAPAATVYDPSGFGFYLHDVYDNDAMTRAYRDMSARAGSPALRAAQDAYANSIRILDQIKPLQVDEKDLPAPPKPYADSELGKSLRQLARMLHAGFGTRVATLNAGGGYDTHDSQPEKHTELLTDLGTSLEAWQADLDARGIADRVLTMVWSEFGRRPEDNESNGTDHGAGGLVLVVGNGANGGIQSEFPGLGRLDEDDNLLVSTEFRTVYATLLEQWLGIEAARVLPGIDAKRLPIIRA